MHEIFFEQLVNSMEKFKVETHAYCLMDNHYHLIVKTPNANLNKFMQHFGSCLSKKVNQEIGGDGALFRSRYRSIIIQSNTYFMQLTKYIHLNPVEANMVAYPSDYELSSYNTYCKKSVKKWLKTKALLSLFNDTNAFKAFHKTGISKDISNIFSKKQLPEKL